MFSLNLAIGFVIVIGGTMASPFTTNDHVKLPYFVPVCNRGDPNLSICLRQAINSLKPRLGNGIPELFIPPIEPLVIPEIKLDQDSGAVYLHCIYTDMRISGLSNFTFSNLHIDPVKLKLTLTMNVPKVSVQSKYTMKGKIMMMPLQGDGTFKADLNDVDLHLAMVGERYRRQDRTYIKVKNIHLDYKLGKAKMHLDNLFNGDKALGDRMNMFLNEQWESLSEEVRPLMEKAAIEVIRASTDKLLNRYSYNDLLPK